VQLRAQREELTRKIARMDEDELDISGMPGGFPSSHPSHGKLCSTNPTYEFEDEPLLIDADQDKL